MHIWSFLWNSFCFPIHIADFTAAPDITFISSQPYLKHCLLNIKKGTKWNHSNILFVFCLTQSISNCLLSDSYFYTFSFVISWYICESNSIILMWFHFIKSHLVASFLNRQLLRMLLCSFLVKEVIQIHYVGIAN